jgi:hypothetical protein
MKPNPVIRGLDVHEHRLPDLPCRTLVVQGFQLPFKRLEKRFGTGESLSNSPCGSYSGVPWDIVPEALHEKPWQFVALSV